MKPNVKKIETKQISSKEAEECANEQIQHLGLIQSHGFVLMVDEISHVIKQYSANFLPLLGLSTDTTAEVLDSDISDWISFESEAPFSDVNNKRLLKLEFTSKNIISNIDWECLAHQTDGFVCLEFVPASKTASSEPELVAALDNIIVNIKGAQGQEELLDSVTRDLQSYTHYDRVMLYRFEPDGSGDVVSEHVSKGNTIRFKGMRFPAEDIPKQARELYKKNTLRVLADVDSQPVQMLPLMVNKKPVDMGLSMLRSMSIMHVRYLQNMGVKATMTISLLYKGELWGLMAFHHNTPKLPPQHLVSQVRATCELFAGLISSHLNKELDFRQLQTFIHAKVHLENIFENTKVESNLAETLIKVADKVKHVLDYDYIGLGTNDCCILSDNDRIYHLDSHASQSLLSLAPNDNNGLYISNKFLHLSAELNISQLANMAGILLIKSSGHSSPFIFFGRNEITKSITWAGEPGTVDIVERDGVRGLEPRSSFALWTQKVMGQSQEWNNEDKEIANILSNSVRELVNTYTNQSLLEQLHRSANYDSLTGLANRQFLRDYIHRLGEQSSTSKSISVFFLDLDNFKNINDYMGHHVGDVVLKAVAKRLQACVRPNDLVVRLGGDEFLIIIDNKQSEYDVVTKRITKIGDNLLAAVNKPIFEKEHSIVTSPSIGVNICDLSKVNFDEIMKQADIALYVAKNQGKNRFHIFSLEDQKTFDREAMLNQHLLLAIEDKTLEVYFQPQVNSQLEITGAEALCRWTHPMYGVIAPDAFIALAEKNSLIYKLGLLVFQLSCAQLSKWMADPNFSKFETLSINVSPAQILSDGFERDIFLAIQEYQVKPENLRIEVTETVFMSKFEDAVNILKSLREKGFTIALDDFGTGFSSLSYLMNLPIDEVKIDKSFIANMDHDDKSFAMVEGIIALCKRLNFEVVAEGVENKIQFNLLKGLGCNTQQGYLFSPAVNGEQFSFDLAHFDTMSDVKLK
jgi:diguanylate cyclase (GGDEF)-like protein